MPESSERGALTEAVFYILLVLQEPTHGYAIMQAIDELTAGRVKLGPGTLYGALSTLLDKGWIILDKVGRDKRKKVYRLTTLGADILAQEVGRLEQLLAAAKGYREE